MNDLKHYGNPPDPGWQWVIKIILIVAVIGYMGERDHQQSKQITRLQTTCEEKS